jgi:NADPH-dependent ferric siderophore reductase
MGFEYHADPCWDDLDGAVLFAGDPDDLDAIAEATDRIPYATHVTVLIEAVSPVQVRAVELAPHVSLTWLVRGESGITHPAGGRGARLGLAVHAWCAEWACMDATVAVHCTVWLGPRTSPHIVRMARALVGAG